MIEAWLPVVGYEDYYEVSNYGRVRRLARVVIKTTKHGKRVPVRRKGGDVSAFSCGGRWYPRVTLTVDFQKRTVSVHTLVLEAFAGPAPKGMECRHLDGKKLNNRLDNLRWGTHPENEADKDLHGSRFYGEDIAQAVLTEADVRYIRRAHSRGRKQYELARQFNVSKATICRAVNGKCWSHVH